jgi:subtilisin family serine protease
MVMFDPDELILILNVVPGEILGKAIQAAFISMLIIFFVNVILFLVLIFRRSARSPVTTENPFSAKIPIFSSIALVVSLIIGGLVYTGAGQKGFHGDYLFAIMKDQADVTSNEETLDYNQRRQFVYRTLVEHANLTQKNLRSTMDRFGIQYKPYYLVNGIMAPDNPFIRLWLQTRPEIDRILDNPQLRPLPERQPFLTGDEQAPEMPQWNITSIGADRAWENFGVMGEGIIIGQSDSGVQGDHPELVDSYRGKGGKNDFNWFDPWYHTTSPNDIMGHGTHTLGSIVGKSTGVAPKATWIACVNLPRNLGNPANYLDCMQFMLAPFPQNGDPLEDGDPTQGAQVLNNSWGCPDIEGCDPNTFLYAVRALRAAGVFFVAGAGNDGPSCGTLNVPPPIYQETFSVGAINRDGTLADFSSIGPVTSDGSGRIKPDILAPGVNILSSFPGSSYGYSSGTSMAGPHVVGVVALIWSANPNLIGDIEQTEQILIQSASSYVGYLPNCPGASEIPSTATGYGILDAYAAVELALGKK